MISTHTSRVGCDPVGIVWRLFVQQFLLTHPVWDVTRTSDGEGGFITISTHTSRVGCDISTLLFLNKSLCISTHTSRVGCDVFLLVFCFHLYLFLLTHPVWDVTAIYSIFQSHYSHILQDGPIIHLELY